MTTITINAGELHIGESPDILETHGVGSCVVVCLYDVKKSGEGKRI